MKRVFILLFVALIAVACAPSQSAIETAVAQTQAAEPTATSLPTATPIPTATAAPTATATPEATAAPLSQLALTYDDIPSALQEYYSKTAVDLKARLNIDAAQATLSRAWVPVRAGAGSNIIVSLARLETNAQAIKASALIKQNYMGGGKSSNLPTSKLALPDSIWAVETNDGYLVAGWVSGRIVVAIEFQIITGADMASNQAVVALLAQAQEKRLRGE